VGPNSDSGEKKLRNNFLLKKHIFCCCCRCRRLSRRQVFFLSNDCNCCSLFADREVKDLNPICHDLIFVRKQSEEKKYRLSEMQRKKHHYVAGEAWDVF
jgi:hypothetical protein